MGSARWAGGVGSYENHRKKMARYLRPGVTHDARCVTRNPSHNASPQGGRDDRVRGERRPVAVCQKRLPSDHIDIVPSPGICTSQSIGPHSPRRVRLNIYRARHPRDVRR